MKKQIKTIILYVFNERLAHIRCTLIDIGWRFDKDDNIDFYSVSEQEHIIILLREYKNIISVINYFLNEKT